MPPKLCFLVGLLACACMILSDCRERAAFRVIIAPGDEAAVPLAPDRDALSALAVVGPRPGNHFRLANGSVVRVISRGVGAVEVETEAGRRGWVFADCVSAK